MRTRNPSLPADFVDLLAAFADADVRYLVVGGYAVGFHDRPRTTKDLDLFLDADRENMRRACDALRMFGVPESIVVDLEAATPEEIVWLGVPPLRVDFLQAMKGASFGDAWDRRVVAEWDGVSVNIVSLDDLIEAKRAAGRPQDLVDMQNLERTRLLRGG